MSKKPKADLTPTLKRALVILFEDGSLLRDTGGWIGSSKRRIVMQTALALYERCLLRIIVESRHRRRHTAKLTEIGEFAAAEVSRQSKVGEFSPKIPGSSISEAALLLVAEIVSP